jgi:hypothetical protein
VLDALQLEVPTVEAEVEYGDGTGAGQRMAQQAELDHIMSTLPSLHTVRILS